MDIKELLNKGVYGFKDLNTGKIVYVGSTNMSFCERLGIHLKDSRLNRHTNPKLSELIKSRNFEFVILEAGEFDKFNILEKERYYSEKYKVLEEGFNLTIGGCRTIECNNPRKSPMYPKCEAFDNVVSFISKNYLNRRIVSEDRRTIIAYCNEQGYKRVHTINFSLCMTKFGVSVTRLSNKRDYILSLKYYE